MMKKLMFLLHVGSTRPCTSSFVTTPSTLHKPFLFLNTKTYNNRNTHVTDVARQEYRLRMSTIASPRPSLTLSSRRTSTSTDTTTLSNHSARPNQVTVNRRNRSALRDYYGLKTVVDSKTRDEEPNTPLATGDHARILDQADFDPEAFVQGLLNKEGLEAVLKMEANLISDIRTLDGEKKALVYDNYSKLIAATDTIRSMREKMDPITPTTKNLSVDIGKISATAAELSQGLRNSTNVVLEDVNTKKTREQQLTVRWALDTPRRLQKLTDEDQLDEAQREWQEVSKLLSQWNGARGVDELREKCLAILQNPNKP